jgi:hypothetical protein
MRPDAPSERRLDPKSVNRQIQNLSGGRSADGAKKYYPGDLNVTAGEEFMHHASDEKMITMQVNYLSNIREKQGSPNLLEEQREFAHLRDQFPFIRFHVPSSIASLLSQLESH